MPSMCQHCNKPFQRPERLKRHVEAVHARGGKTFACKTCGKIFSRSDNCLCHERNHATSTGAVMLEHGRRTYRACNNCAGARSKCDGEDRCIRCGNRELECVYSKRRSKQAAENQALDQQAAPVLPRLRADAPYNILPSASQMPEYPPVGPAEPDPFLSVPVSAQPVPMSSAVDMDMLWTDNMNWLPVSNDEDLLNMADMDMGLLWDPFRNGGGGGSHFDTISTVNSQGFSSRVDMQTPNTMPSNDVSTISPLSSHSIATKSSGPGRTKRRRLSRYVMAKVLETLCRTYRAILVKASGGKQTILTRYEELRRQFHDIVEKTSRAFTPQMLGTNFPSLEDLNHCFGLYAQHLQPEYPVVHNTTWADESTPWFLVLAAVTAGASREDSKVSRNAPVTFLEFLRRALHVVDEEREYRGSLALAQAYLLYLVAVAPVAASRLSSATVNLRVAVDSLSCREGSISKGDPTSAESLADTWRSWIAEGSRTRVRLFEWQLRLLLSVSSNAAEDTGLPAHDLRLPWPATIWDARTPDSWIALKQDKIPPRLWSALEKLYIRYVVDPTLDAVGQYLLVYAVVGRTQEVHRRLQQPLRQWSPAPDEESSGDEKADDVLPSVGWLPANSEYAAWRNSACDSLDTLHWRANSEIAAAKGLEGPIILHLHLARLILLCPYKALRQLAGDLARQSGQFDGIATAPVNNPRPLNATPAGKRAFDSVAKWITLDDHKQRLSLVHAGAIFWHIRRYSRGSFIEPFAIFVSTLVIWFTGCFQPSLQATLLKNKSRLAEQRGSTSRGLNSEENALEDAAESEDEEDDTAPAGILLDHPCDDEIVQIFVRRGHDMQVLMSGAGHIMAAYGMRRVLQEGIKLLRYAHYSNNARCAEYERILGGIVSKSNTSRT